MTSPVPVAIELQSSATALLPDANRSAMIPDPTTIASRPAVPTNSAASFRESFMVTCSKKTECISPDRKI
jgi:hypothetical protein